MLDLENSLRLFFFGFFFLSKFYFFSGRGENHYVEEWVGGEWRGNKKRVRMNGGGEPSLAHGLTNMR